MPPRHPADLPTPQTTSSPLAASRRGLTAWTLIAAAALAPALAPGTAQAQSAQAANKPIRIPAGNLEDTLNAYARQASITLSFDPALMRGKHSDGLDTTASVRDGLAALLARHRLQAVPVGDNSYAVRALPESSGADTVLAPIVVTGANETAYSHVDGYVARRSATGTKTDSALIETPQSISIITADRIASMAASRVTDALAYTPGVKTFDGFDTRYDWLSIRGFDAYSPGFYQDGLLLRNNAGYSIWRVESYGAERIEVMRGPTSVLYGQNSPGGMVNVVSKRPTEEPLHELQVQVGNYSQRQIAGDFSGPVDEAGKVLYRITGIGLDSDTQVDHVKDKRVYIAPALTLRPSSDTTLTLLSQVSQIRAGNSYGFLPVDGTLLSTPNGRVPTHTFVGEPDVDRYNQDQWNVGYLLEHRFNDVWTVRQNARYGEIKTDYRQVYQSGYLTEDADNPKSPANYRKVGRVVFGSREHGSLGTIDNQVQAKLRSGDWLHTVLVGLDLQRGRYQQKTFFGEAPSIDIFSPVYGQPVTIPDPYQDTTSTLTQTGLYLQDQIKWADRWVATLGGRYDRSVIDTDNHLDSSSSRQTDSKFTGRAGLVYLAPNGLAPYASYSTSFLPITTVDPKTNRPFNPETGRQYEVGLRYQPPGTRDSYSIALFDLRRQNVMTFDREMVPVQTGEVMVRGMELEMAMQPITGMNLLLSYTWTPDARVTKNANPDKIGTQLTATPRNQASAWGDYRFANGIKVGMGVRFVGATDGANSSAPAKVPAYTLFDAMLGYDFQHWSLALNARNLADKIYVGRNCDSYNCGYGERRRVMATATYRW